MYLFEVSGTYGSNHISCTVLCATQRDGTTFYCVQGSSNVNQTLETELMTDGVDVETIEDFDYFSWGEPIDYLNELEDAINA